MKRKKRFFVGAARPDPVARRMAYRREEQEWGCISQPVKFVIR